jgi:hypothetical protein
LWEDAGGCVPFLCKRHELSGTDDVRSHSHQVCLNRRLPHYFKWNIKEVQSSSQLPFCVVKANANVSSLLTRKVCWFIYRRHLLRIWRRRVGWLRIINWRCEWKRSWPSLMYRFINLFDKYNLSFPAPVESLSTLHSVARLKIFSIILWSCSMKRDAVKWTEFNLSNQTVR